MRCLPGLQFKFAQRHCPAPKRSARTGSMPDSSSMGKTVRPGMYVYQIRAEPKESSRPTSRWRKRAGGGGSTTHRATRPHIWTCSSLHEGLTGSRIELKYHECNGSVHRYVQHYNYIVRAERRSCAEPPRHRHRHGHPANKHTWNVCTPVGPEN